MLIVYDAATGEVLDNTGTNSAWPAGPPDDLAYVNTDNQGIARVGLGLLRIHDLDQADLVQRVLSHYVHVENGEVVIGDLIPPPAPDPQVAVRLTLEERALAALDTNRTFLNVKSPTNAQTLAQVRALTQQNNGLIRLVLNKLDGVE